MDEQTCINQSNEENKPVATEGTDEESHNCYPELILPSSDEINYDLIFWSKELSRT
jgi:hypothetical protein